MKMYMRLMYNILKDAETFLQNSKESISEKLDLKPWYSEVASCPQIIQMIEFNYFVLIFQNDNCFFISIISVVIHQ